MNPWRGALPFGGGVALALALLMVDAGPAHAQNRLGGGNSGGGGGGLGGGGGGNSGNIGGRIDTRPDRIIFQATQPFQGFPLGYTGGLSGGSGGGGFGGGFSGGGG